MIKTRHFDYILFILMAAAFYVFFPFGRWIDHAPLSTLLITGYLYLAYIVNRLFCIPMFFMDGRRRVAAVMVVIGAVVVMAALTHYGQGWPFYYLEEHYKDWFRVEMSQQKLWLLFVTVLVASTTMGIISRRTRRDTIQPRTDTITVKAERKNILIALADIIYIEAMGNYVFFNLTGGRQVKSQTTLTSIVSQLPSDDFLRIHKSYVVGRRHITSFNSRQLVVGYATLPIGRAYTDEVRSKLQG